MYPDFLSAFGVRLYGVGFERVLWILGILLMGWGLWSSYALWRQDKRLEGAIQGAITLVAFLWFGVKLWGTIFSPADYSLMFTEELTLHTYALSILVGIILAVYVALRSAKREGMDPWKLFNLILMLLVFGFLGARAAFVLGDASHFYQACFDPAAAGLAAPDCLKPFKVWEGGLTFYGGVLAGLVVVYVHQRQSRHSMLQTMDVLTPSLALAHAFGRMGCLAAGCCWGAPTTGRVGLVFDSHSFAYAAHLKAQQAGSEAYAQALADGHTPLLHATQIYEIFGELLLFFILIVYLSRRRAHGRVLATWLIGYGGWRFTTEFMRGDAERGYLFEYSASWINRALSLEPQDITMLSTSQAIGFAMIVLGLFIFRFTAKRAAKHKQASHAPESANDSAEAAA